MRRRKLTYTRYFAFVLLFLSTGLLLQHDSISPTVEAKAACSTIQPIGRVGVEGDNRNFIVAGATATVLFGVTVPMHFRDEVNCIDPEVPSSGIATITLPSYLTVESYTTSVPGTVVISDSIVTFTHSSMGSNQEVRLGGAGINLVVRDIYGDQLPDVAPMESMSVSWSYTYPTTGSGSVSASRNVALTYSKERITTTRTEPVGVGDVIDYNHTFGGYPHFNTTGSTVDITIPYFTEFVPGSISTTGSTTITNNILSVNFGNSAGPQSVSYSIRVTAAMPESQWFVRPNQNYRLIVSDATIPGIPPRKIHISGTPTGGDGRVYVRPKYTIEWIPNRTNIPLDGEVAVTARYTNISASPLTDVKLELPSVTYTGQGLVELVQPIAAGVSLAPGESANVDYRFKGTRVGPVKVSAYARALLGTTTYYSIPAVTPELCVECESAELSIGVPDRRFEVGDQFPAIIKVASLQEDPLTITFNDPLLKERTKSGLPEDNLLTVDIHDTPLPFVLDAKTPSREFPVMVRVNELGVAELVSSLSYEGGTDVKGELTTVKKISAPPFDVRIEITPKQAVLNQTPANKKTARCRELEKNSTTINNCIEIKTTVRNDSDRAISNVRIPNADNPLTLINSVDPKSPGVPLTEIEHNFPASSVNLAPGQEATWIWRMNAFDAPSSLEFEPTVFGVMGGLEVGGHANKKFQILDNVLLKWGMRPVDDVTSQPSGQPIRAEGYIENTSMDDGGEEKLLRALVYQMPERNAGGGFVFRASATGGATPTTYEIFDLPGEGAGKRIDLRSVFRTARMEHTTTGRIRYGVRLWVVEKDGTLTSASDQVQLDDEAYVDDFSVLLTPTQIIVDQYVEECLARGFQPIVCSFNQAFAGEFADGMFGLYQFGLTNLESGGEAVARSTIYAIRGQYELIKASLGNEEAKAYLMQELYVQYRTFHSLGVLSGQVAGQAPMVFEAFAIQTVGSLDNFLRAIDEGDMTSLQVQTGRFFGANPDLLLEPLMVAASFAKMSKAMKVTQTGLADNIYTAAAKQKAIAQQASVETRLAAAGNRSEDLAKALVAGDRLTPSVLRRVFGISDTQVQRLHNFAKKNEIILAFRSRSRLAQILLDTNIAWPKPMALKQKTVNEIDIRFLGYRRRAEARIEIVEPPAMLKDKTGAELEDALDEYIAALKQQNPELAQNAVLAQEARDRMATRTKEWSKYNPELRLENLEDEVSVGVNFGLNEQLTKDAGEIGVSEQRRIHRTPVESVTDQVDGSTRRVWEIKMDGPNGSGERYVTGDIDFLAILDKHGRMIMDTDKRIALYVQMQEFMEHGESFSYRYQQLRESGSFLDCCVEGTGESMITVGPWEGPPVAGYFVKNLSVMDRFNASFKRVRGTEVETDAAGKVIRDANGRPAEIELRHEDPSGEFMLINGTPLLNNADRAFVARFQPLLFEVVYQEFLERVRYYFPLFLERMLDDPQTSKGLDRVRRLGDTQPDFRIGGPVAQPDAMSEISLIRPNGFRIWTADKGWTDATREEVIAAGEPGVRDIAPNTSLFAPSAEGSISLNLTSAARMGLQANPLTRGDVVVINPGGLNQETATVLEPGSGVLLSPLLHEHQVGEMVAVIGHIETRGFAISGKVSTPDGRGVARALVKLTNPDGTVRTTVTNSFGNYRIDLLPADGLQHTLSVSERRHIFAAQTITMTGDLFIDFLSTPPE